MMKQNFDLIKKGFLNNLPSMMFVALGGIVNTFIDTALISKRLGEIGIAALNLCMPVYLILCMISMLFATGSVTLSAKASGQNNRELERAYYHNTFTLYIITGAITTALGIVSLPLLCKVLSAGNHELSKLIYDYSFVTFIGVFPLLVIGFFQMYLNLDGKNKAMSISMTIMVFLDLLLDLLFLFVFRWGMAGAATASVVATLTASVYAFICLGSANATYRFNWKELGITHTLEIMKYGLSAALANLTDTIKSLTVNSVIMLSLGTSGMALWAVINTLTELSMTISSGISLTGSPMIAIFYASKENDYVRYLAKLEMKIGILLMAVYASLTVFLNSSIKRFFGLEESIFIPVLCMGIFLVIDMAVCVFIKYFNSTEKIMISNTLTLLKRLICPVVVILILSYFKGDLWLFLPISAILSIVLAIIITKIAVVRSQKGNTAQYKDMFLLDDHLEQENKLLDFSVNTDVESICESSEKVMDLCISNHMDRETALKISLSLEEMMVVLINEFPDAHNADFRVFTTDKETGIQIRILGKPYNIFLHNEGEEAIGIDMIKELASNVSCNYVYLLGCNTYQIFINR